MIVTKKMAITHTVRISIGLGNAAFEGNYGGPEIARILRELADRYEIEGKNIYQKLRDINGNVVGEVRVDHKPS